MVYELALSLSARGIEEKIKDAITRKQREAQNILIEHIKDARIPIEEIVENDEYLRLIFRFWKAANDYDAEKN